jgi:UDP-N-acetylglucosamine:LPS N-acetylglucosamine transferase
LIEDKAFTAEKFIDLITTLAWDYDKMKQACLAMAKPLAAERIVDALFK